MQVGLREGVPATKERNLFAATRWASLRKSQEFGDICSGPVGADADRPRDDDPPRHQLLQQPDQPQYEQRHGDRPHYANISIAKAIELNYRRGGIYGVSENQCRIDRY